MVSKVARRSYNQIPDCLKDMSGLEAFKAQVTPPYKVASTQEEPTMDFSSVARVVMGTPDAEQLLKTCSINGNIHTASNGHIWRVAEVDGVEYLMRDDELTDDNMAVNDLMEGVGNEVL